MNVPLLLLRRFGDSVPGVRHLGVGALGLGVLLSGAASVIFVVVLIRAVDAAQLGGLIESGLRDPAGWLIALGGFAAAFAIRAFAWRRLAPGLSFGHSLAGIHLALGANHVLPLRLGEPLRVLSVLARTAVPAGVATASSITLRLGDIVSLLVIAAVLAPAALLDVLGATGALLASAVTAALVLSAIVAGRMAQRSVLIRRPDAITAALTVVAWFFEALVMWTVAGWAGADLSLFDSLLVTVLAVAAQLVAIAPGGFGTYEAAAVAGLVLVGVDPSTGLVVAVAAHGMKTIYSLVAGGVALFAPAPSVWSSLRLSSSNTPAMGKAVEPGPVVLFLPAFQEGPRIADVIARAPSHVDGRELVVLVIDDGSTDDTVEKAREAGAAVHSLGVNHGLGRAVAVGFEQAVREFDAAVVVFCDADGEYDPAEIDRLVKPILDGEADYVVGSRFAGTIRWMRPHRRFGNQTLTRCLRWITRTPITDGQSGYRALSREAAAGVVMAHDYNYAQVLTIDLLQRGARYVEVPIDYHFRDSGESFVKLGRYLRAVVPTVVRLVTQATAADSILDDVTLELRKGIGPLRVVPSCVALETIDRGERHVHHVMEIVGDEQALPPKNSDAGD